MTEISDSEFAERCRVSGVPGFFKLLELLKSDIAAARAMRAEARFIKMRPDLPLSAEFASQVRRLMVDQKLQWNDEGLQAAVDQVLATWGKSA